MKTRESRLSGWLVGGVGCLIAACGLFKSGTESGNPSFEPDGPLLPGNDGLPNHSVPIPGSRPSDGMPSATAGFSATASTPITNSAAVPSIAPPVASGDAPTQAGSTVLPPPSAPVHPGNASSTPLPSLSSGGVGPPPLPTTSFPTTPSGACSQSTCLAAAQAAAAALAAPSPNAVADYRLGSCEGVGSAQVCHCSATSADAALLNIALNADCLLQGRVGCLLSAPGAQWCGAPEASQDAGYAAAAVLDCSELCITATELLVMDAQAQRAVEVLSATCAGTSCESVLRVDASRCFLQPGMLPLPCP